MTGASNHHVSPTAEAVTERWEVDGARSSLTFRLRHIVVQRIDGRFSRWGGALFINRREPSLSSIEIWVDLASIETGSPVRDAHVRSSEFLDVARFPRAEFRSADVQLRDEQVIVQGRLDLHGVVRDLAVRAVIGPVTIDADGQERSRYTAYCTVDRQSYHLHWNQDLDGGGIVVGDHVEILGEVELVRTDGERRMRC